MVWAVLITQTPGSVLSISTVRPANSLHREIYPATEAPSEGLSSFRKQKLHLGPDRDITEKIRLHHIGVGLQRGIDRLLADTK